MQEEEALDFYQRVTEGTERYQEISLEHSSGATLNGVKMHSVDKTFLAKTISTLPDEMFSAVEDAEDAEEAEEELEQQGSGLDAVNEDTIEAFEELCTESLKHPELTKPQLQQICEELNFEVLFSLGTEIINMSVEDTGAIRDFHKQG